MMHSYFTAIDEQAAAILSEQDAAHALTLRVTETLHYIDLCAAVLATFCATGGVFTQQVWLGALALGIAGGWAFLRDEAAANVHAHYERKDGE